VEIFFTSLIIINNESSNETFESGSSKKWLFKKDEFVIKVNELYECAKDTDCRSELRVWEEKDKK
jgi:hypothetical protein